MTPPLTSLEAQDVISPHCQEKVTQIKSMYLCVIKQDAAPSSHHPHHGAVWYLQHSPQHSNHTALGLAGQEHLLCHTSQGMGWKRGDLHGHDKSNYKIIE